MALILVIAAPINSVIDLGSLSLDTKALFPSDPGAAVSADLASVTRHLSARITWGLTSIGFSLVTIAAVATAAVSADSLFDNLSYLIFLMLAAAASAALLWPTADRKSPALLRRRIARVQALLFIGATALALRALEMYFLYRWPGAWLTGPMAQAVDEIALAVSTGYGSFYTAVLAAIYLPTAFVLRSRANALADGSGAGTAEEHDGWLAKSGLQFQPFHEFGRLLVVLAPFLAGGPVAKVIGLIGG